MELYRKVPCSERLPEPLIEVDSDKGKWVYYPDDPYVNFFPSYWLEPIDLPPDEEIEKMSSFFAKKCDPDNKTLEKQADIYFGFKQGFKTCLELLTKGGTK